MPRYQDLRDKYAQDLVRLANYIKIGTNRSELLIVCNVGTPAVNALFKALVELLFDEMSRQPEDA